MGRKLSTSEIKMQARRSYASDTVDKLLEKMSEAEVRALASAPAPLGYVNLSSASILAELDRRAMIRARDAARERVAHLPWWRRIFL